MKKQNKIYTWAMLLCMALGFIACSDETPSPTEANYVPLNEITQQMNNRNMGSYTGDEKNDYFQYYENGMVSLYKKERETGALTLLDQREGSGTTDSDVNYSNFYLYGEHLYFMLYDYRESDLRNVLCRVPVNGEAPMEKIADLGDTYGIHFYKGGKAYVMNRDVLHEVSLQNGARTALFEIPSGEPSLLVGDYLYAFEYTRTPEPENKFYVKVNRCKMDGSGQQTVLDNPDIDGMVLTALDDRIYTLIGNTVHSMTMEGKDMKKHLELTDDIWSVHTDGQALYLLTSDVSTGSDFKVYTYRPESDVLQSVYQAGNLNYYLMLNGYGELVLPTPLEESRFGHLRNYGRIS